LDSFDKPQILKTESVGTCQVLSPRNCEERLALGLIDAAVCVGSDGKAVAEIFGALRAFIRDCRWLEQETPTPWRCSMVR
jgi:hypothetical protein